jgi:hypothetical protein
VIKGWKQICQEYMLEYFEERAAIMQYEGGCTRERAEELAYGEMLQKWWSPVGKA